MRSILSALAVLLSLVLAAAALPTLWLQANVVQEQGFVALAAPLGADAEFQQALSQAAGTTVATSLDLPLGLGSLVEPLVAKAAAALNTDPGYPEAWTQTLARSHRLSVSAPGTPEAPETMALDVAPLLGLVVDRLAASVGADVKAPETVQIPVGSAANRAVVSRVAQAGPWGVWLAAGSAVALVAGLVLARRRSTTLLLAGLGLAVVSAGWKIAAGAAAAMVEAVDTGNPVAQLFKDRFVQAATENLDGWILAGAITAGVLVLTGAAARLAVRRSA
ncbi:hypothetical protein [Arthrobacter sp. 35W]|uniref:hypothetical protein n=1 Tax=Arthrobacter sp. 35W TaxID=1132441 RepID=UPI0004042066|nr:hypothetical protein [Arthrobacter sp. 35W]